MAKIKTIPKEAMSKVTQHSPDLIERSLLLYETVLKNMDKYGKKAKTLHQERKG